MPPSSTLADHDRRILAGRAAGATTIDLALAEEVDPASVRQVLVSAGIIVQPTTPVHLAPSPTQPG
jgi:hypothetical protein